MAHSKEKVYLQFINLFMQMIFAFFNIFFSIFIYDLSSNINFVLSYNLFHQVIILVAEFVIAKLLTSKSFNIIYRLGFVFAILSIGLTFLITADRLYMVFIVQFVYAVASILYYMPHEVATMHKNDSSQMKGFLAIQSVLGLVSGFLSPFITGYIIDFVSYYVLFSIILLFAGICFGLSFGINNGYTEVGKIKFSEYWVKAHKIKSVRLGLLSYGILKFAQDMAYSTVLTLLLFMRTGTNFSVGLYSALASLIASIVLLLYMKFSRNKAVAMWVSTICDFVMAVVLVILPNFVAFIIYYFVSTVAKKIVHNGVYETHYCSIIGTSLEPYKKIHRLAGSVYNQALNILAILITFVAYNFFKNAIALSIVLIVFSGARILTTALMLKSDACKKAEC